MFLGAFMNSRGRQWTEVSPVLSGDRQLRAKTSRESRAGSGPNLLHQVLIQNPDSRNQSERNKIKIKIKLLNSADCFNQCQESL